MKDVTVNNKRYQVGDFSARDGSWIASQFMPLILTRQEFSENEDDKKLAGALAAWMSGFPEDVYERVRQKCFAVLRGYKLVGNQETPEILFNGEHNIFGLNLAEQTTLVLHALAHNLGCFFVKGSAETLRTILPDLSNPSAPGSTATS